jgi:predicted nucleic acid-binding protein
MITAIDSSVALDLLIAGSAFGAASRDALRQCSLEGKLVVCDVVWAEVGAFFPSSEEATRCFERLQFEFDSIGPAAALHAGVTWSRYRRQGGKREHMVPDFLIGSHAVHHADRLLTRDRGVFRAYYPSLVLVDPARSGRPPQ